MIELWFITIVVNTISLAPQHFEASNLEVVGRVLTGIGCVVFLLSICVTKRNNKSSFHLRGIRKAWIIVAFSIGFFGVKTVINWSAETASDEVLMCSTIGSMVRSLISDGEKLEIEQWADESQFYSIEEFQLGLVYAPAATCFNASFFSQALSDPLIRRELIDSSINSKVVKMEADFLEKSITSLIVNFNQIYTGLIKVERSWYGERAIEKFHDVAWQKKLDLNPFVFNRVFERNKAYGARLTQDQAFEIIVEEILNNAKIELDDVTIHRKMSPSVATKILLNDIANKELAKLDNRDFSAAQQFLESAKVAYKTAVVPVILISVSTVLIALNLITTLLTIFTTVVQLLFNERSFKLGFKSTITLLVATLIVAAWLPSTRTQSSIFGSAGLSTSSAFIWFGYRAQSFSFPPILAFLHENSIASNPFWYTRKISDTKEVDEIKASMARALNEHKYLTPIGDSAAWHAMELNFFNRLSESDSYRLKRAFEYYASTDLSEEQFLLKASYADHWLESHIDRTK